MFWVAMLIKVNKLNTTSTHDALSVVEESMSVILIKLIDQRI